MRRATLQFLAAMAVSAAAGGFLQTADLKLNLTPGSKFRYKTVVNTNMTGAGQPQNFTQSITQQVVVKSMSAKGYRVKTTILDATVTGTNAQMMKPTLQKLKGTTVEATFTKTGKTLDLTSSATGMSKAMMNSFGSMDVGFMGIMFPGRPVSVGQSWTTSLDIKKMLAQFPGAEMFKVTKGGKFPVRYTLMGIKSIGGKQIATIGTSMSGSTTLSMTMPKGKGASGRQNMNMTMDLRSNGTSQVDAGTGVLRASTSTANVNISVMGMNMQQKLVTNTKLQ